MNQQISNRTIHEAEILLSDHPSHSQTIGERLEYPRKGVQRIPLCPGLELAIENYHPKENLVANVEVEPPPIGFAFCLSGKIRGTVRGQKGELIFGAGQTGLWFSPYSRSTIEYLVEEPICWVSVRIDPWLLNTFMQGQFDQIPADLRGIIDGSKEKHYNRISSITPSMYMSIHQILNCPYRGLIKQMYLESKAIELISHQLDQVFFAKGDPKNKLTLRQDDIERISYARDLLIATIQNPLTILELSRMSGINDTKLKRGFRQLYGTSIHEYLLAHRFERARDLLAEGNMNVSEVSYAVGYSKVDNFASSFKKRFGITPGAFRRESINTFSH